MDSKKVLFQNAMLAVAISAALGLAGCGGGSDDGDSATTSFIGTTSGKVAKGIVKNGLVTAQELNASGIAVQTFDTVLTDETGNYTLVIGEAYENGPILLTITPNTNPAEPTQMKCDVAPECGGPGSTDAPDFGDWMDVDPDFEMQAILPVVEYGGDVSAQITPFTHMAASRALNDVNGVSASSVSAAISEVSQIVGVPIMSVEPVDITDPEAVANASTDDLVYAVFVAGMGDLLFSNDAGIVSGLEDLASVFADGAIDADEAIVISDLTDAVTAQTSQLEIAYPDVDLTEVIADINTAVAVIESQTGEDGSYDPAPTDSANLSAVEQAKALVSETRTLITSLEALESPADAFAGDLDIAAEVVDQNSEALFEILGIVLEAVFVELDARSVAGILALETFSVAIVDSTGTPIGDVTVTLSDNNGLALSIIGSGLSGVDMDLGVSTNLPADELLADQSFILNSANLSISGSVENAEASISLTEASLTINLLEATTFNPDTGVTDPIEPNVTGLELSGGMIIEDKASSTTFTGSASVSVIALEAGSADDPSDPKPISLSAISLDGEFADLSNSFTASVGLTVNNAATFDTFSLLEHDPNMWVHDSVVIDLFNTEVIASSEFGITNLSRAFYDSWSNRTCFEGFVDSFTYINECVNGDYLGAAGIILEEYPEAISVDWIFFEYSPDYGTHYSGEVTFPDFENAENFADVTLTASLDLELSGHPDTSVVISVNRSELEGGDATLTFIHDRHSIRVEVEKAAGADAIGSVTVTNPDGVEMALTGLTDAEVSISGTLTVNDVQVGTISETDAGLAIIRYDDGTFESLN